jgi:hypothetical protein
MIELLDNNQDKQVQHDMRAHEDNQIEEPKVIGSARAAVDADDAGNRTLWGSVAIVHYFVPIFTCGQGEYE